MGVWGEIQSLFTPKAVPLTDAPRPGSPAPSTEKLKVPQENGKPLVVTFLRHCGCPFAEKTFVTLRNFASDHPDVNFVAVSHSSQEATDTWLKSLPPSQGGKSPDNLKLIVDDSRELYGQWGLGTSGFWHVFNSDTIAALGTLKKEDGIANRPTESGSRWQTSGTYAVDDKGVVKWGGPVDRADYVPKWEEPLQAVSAY